MYYAIKVSPSVANTRTDGLGHRNRTVATSGGLKTLTFSRQPTVLDWLPPEVDEDPHLVVTKIRKLPKGQRLTQLEPPSGLKPERVQKAGGSGDEPPAPDAPLTDVKGIGPATAEALAGKGLETLADLAAADLEALAADEELNLPPATVKAIEKWQAGTGAALSQPSEGPKEKPKES